jgi:hypothetical protein
VSNWRQDVSDKSSLSLFKEPKINFEISNYLNKIHGTKLRNTRTKLKLTIQRLADIETVGDWKENEHVAILTIWKMNIILFKIVLFTPTALGLGQQFKTLPLPPLANSLTVPKSHMK